MPDDIPSFDDCERLYGDPAHSATGLRKGAAIVESRRWPDCHDEHGAILGVGSSASDRGGVTPGDDCRAPAEPADPADRHIFAAVEGTRLDWCPDGAWSCEALGPKIQGGVEGVPPSLYMFVQRPDRLADCTRTFDGIREFLTANVMEGIVWHDPDGRLAKIKRRDFGLRWPPPTPPA